MTLTFKKYNSIENHYREKYINEIYKYGYENEIYVVQEKIDGANFSFITNGNEIRVASRNQFVDGQFFNCQSVIDKYKDEVINIFNLLQNDSTENILSIQLYGELFGDSIQNRVKYIKEKDFIPFDLLVNYENETVLINNLELNFLLFENTTLFNKTINLYFGNLIQCLDYCKNNLNKNSFVAQNYFTDYKDLVDNVSEGFIIKPIKNLYFDNGERVILKYKNTKFLERENPKFKEKKDINLTDKENEILNNLISYINENRLNSVISKTGKITENEVNGTNVKYKDFSKLLGMMSQDILIDFGKDFEDIKVNKNVNKQFMNECSKFIRSKFVNLIDT